MHDVDRSCVGIAGEKTSNLVISPLIGGINLDRNLKVGVFVEKTEPIQPSRIRFAGTAKIPGPEPIATVCVDLGVKNSSAGVANVLDGLTFEVLPNGGFQLSLGL